VSNRDRLEHLQHREPPIGGGRHFETTSLARAIEIAKASPVGMDPNASIEIRELGGYSA
jgi:hypothetical protein